MASHAIIDDEVRSLPLPVKRRQKADPPARTRVYDYVRKAILLGEFPGGTFIEEEEMSRRIGVSRTPVREAFHQLHAEQFIDLMPRKGAMVRQVSARELHGLFQTRILIEGSVMEMICRDRPPIPASIAEIIEGMKALKSLPSRESKLEFTDLDWQLHCAIVEMSGNEVLVETYKTLRSRYERVVRSVDVTKEHLSRVYQDHVRLLGLLQLYDIDGLRELLHEHLALP